MMGNENLLPKNIRQIGEIQGRRKICLEDYVMTYIRKMESRGDGNYLGVLLGERRNTDDAEYVFVRGIMEVPDFSRMREEKTAEKRIEEPAAADDGLTDKAKKDSKDGSADKAKKDSGDGSKNQLGGEKKTGSSDNTKGGAKDKSEEEIVERDWSRAWKQEQERRFPGWEIQGCCVIGTYPSGRLEALSACFPEAARMLYHLQDQEERLYWQEGEQYEGIRGYFVFYEQNRQMQEYLSELFGGGSVEKEGGSEDAIIRFREKVKSKAEEKSQSFLRLASSFFVVGVLIIGVLVVNRVSDRREAQEAEEAALVLDVAESESPAEKADDSNGAADGAAGVSEAATADGAADVSAAATAGEVIDDREAATADETAATTDEALSVSGEFVLAGSDAFWADEADDPAESSSDADTGTTAAADASEDTVLTDTGTVNEIVTDTESTTETAAAEAVETANRQVQAAYVIREGDTLAEICARYYGSLDRMEELCEANGIEDADLILPGQKIVLP
ncbi:MAG: LysM peptidoglycan-binding domain-containing protein [Lachnospiraceae bacterium]|nr:LysM peptidoglycan-binding domain-containing protein [Lachnospiraceae bacterium]